MIKRTQQARYRSFKYISSTTNLIPYSKPPQLNSNLKKSKPQLCRLSLNKENKSEPFQFRQRAQTPKFKQQKTSNRWCQNKIYNTSSVYKPINSHPSEKNQQQYNFFQPISIPKNCQCPPYQIYLDRLQVQIQLCSQILDQQKSVVQQLTKDIHNLKINTDKSLKDSEKMVSRQISRLKQIMKESLGEHSKIIVNSKENIALTQKVYADTLQSIAGIRQELSQMDDSFNF